MLSAHATACAGAARVVTQHCPTHIVAQVAFSAGLALFAGAALLVQYLIERNHMPKLTTFEAAVVGEITSGAAIGVALGFITNHTDQLVVALAPSIIANLGVIAVAIKNEISAQGAALVSAVKANRL